MFDMHIEEFFQDCSKALLMLYQNFPKKMTVEVSNDAVNWQAAGSVKNQTAAQEKGTLMQDFTVTLSSPQKVRYVRIVGESLKKCPKWHKGAGNPCWVFVDEVWAK